MAESACLCVSKRHAARHVGEGADLPIPPPAHQGAVHQPGLRADVRHREEVRLHEGDQVGPLVIVVELSVGEPGGRGGMVSLAPGTSAVTSDGGAYRPS